MSGKDPDKEITRMRTVRETAAAASLHESTVYRAIKLGSIAAVRIGGAIRIPNREYRRLTGADAA